MNSRWVKREHNKIKVWARVALVFQVSDQLQMYTWDGVLLSACNQMAALPLWLLSEPGKELNDFTKFI